MLGTLFLLLAFTATEDKPAPKFPLGKDTTYFTGPLDREGFVDFEAALNDRLGKGITADNNANVLLWKAMGPRPEGGSRMPAEFFQRLGIEEPAERGNYFVDVGTYLKDHAGLDPEKVGEISQQQLDRALQGPWTEKDHPQLAAWLKANDKPLALVVEASKRPEYYNPLVSRRDKEEVGSLIGVLLPGVQKCRSLATALIARAYLRLAEGKFDDAWQDLIACHRLGRLLARGGTLIETLVGVAIDQIAANAELRYLERAEPDTRQVRDRLKELQSLPPLPPVADKIDLGERMMFLDCVRLVRRGGLGTLEALSNGPTPGKPSPAEQKALAALDWTPALRNGNRWYDRMAAAMRLKDRTKREAQFNAIEEELKALQKSAANQAAVVKALQEGKDPGPEVSQAISDVLILLLVPAVHKVQYAHDRAEQVQRNLLVAFALAAYHRENGRYPEKLDALAPKYLPTVPTDFFSGKPLVYRPSENGYLLYSVGVNGKDEDGRWYDDTPPGDDPRVRMPLPEPKSAK